MKALLSGSFDPPTLGHLNLIARASALFTDLYVGVGVNLAKAKPLFSIDEKILLLKEACSPYKNVKVIEIKGLTVDFAREHRIDVLLRGVRDVSDMGFEFQLASANRKLTGIETLFLPADSQFSHISGTLIREIASARHSLKEFVSPEVERLLLNK